MSETSFCRHITALKTTDRDIFYGWAGEGFHLLISRSKLDWPQSLMSIFFSKTDNLSKIAIYKLYLEVEILGLTLNLTIREDRIFRR